MKLHEEVKHYCQRRRISQRALAIQAGIEPGLLNAYVHGKRPNRRNAERVAAVLGISPRDLFPNFDELRRY